jgi:hypothetical protein
VPRHTTHEARSFKVGNTYETGGLSSSSVSNSMGTPSPTPTTYQDSLTIEQPEPVGNALALFPIVGDEAHSDHSPETTPQHLINDLLGMHLSFPCPVNDLLNTFNFILKYCIPPSHFPPLHHLCIPKSFFFLCLPSLSPLVEETPPTASPPSSSNSWSIEEPS